MFPPRECALVFRVAPECFDGIRKRRKTVEALQAGYRLRQAIAGITCNVQEGLTRPEPDRQSQFTECKPGMSRAAQRRLPRISGEACYRRGNQLAGQSSSIHAPGRGQPHDTAGVEQEAADPERIGRRPPPALEHGCEFADFRGECPGVDATSG